MTETSFPDGSAGRRPRPIERFLGSAESSGGPFALLGLVPGDCDDDAVLNALDQQIERVAAHPECDTPEADEVRLALHAAAAQLLDPVVRRHLVAKWTGASPPPLAASSAAPGGQPHAHSARGLPRHAPSPRPTRHATPSGAAGSAQALKLLEHDAILTLGLFGGWNQRSLRRLVSLANARGCTNEQVAEALRNISSHRRPAKTAAKRPSSRPRARPRVAEAGAPSPALGFQVEPSDPSQSLLRNAMILGAVALAGLFAAVLIIIWLTSGTATGGKATRGGGGTIAPPPVVSGPGPATGALSAPLATAPSPGAPAKPLPKPLTSSGDVASIGRDIAACVEATQVDPAEAEAKLERVLEVLAANWARLPRDRLIAAHDSIVEFLYRSATSPDLPVRVVEAIARTSKVAGGARLEAEGVLPSIWSAGMLVRLSRERDLSALTKAAIESGVAAALSGSGVLSEQTFEAGAGAALAAMPQRLTAGAGRGAPSAGDVAAWERWAQGVDAFAGPDSAARQRLLLAGMEVLLVDGPEPNVNQGAGDVIAMLVMRLTWRAEDESRRWLLKWFDDRRMTAADLHAVTSVLATRSSAEGIDITMVLSTSAADRTRADLRDRYATVWGVQSQVNRDELTATWIAAAKAAIERSLSGGDEADQLASATVLARLSEAAALQWRGDGGEAATIVAALTAPVDQAMALASTGPSHQRLQASDGGWGEKYLAARQNVRVKQEMLEQLGLSIGELGPIDAEIVTREAILGAPASIRAKAQEIIKQFSGNPAVINALLEQLPRMQRMATNSALIEYVCQRQLPSLRDPDWAISARRALVEQLLEAQTAESPRARIDRVAGVLATSYRSMASPTPLTPVQRAQRLQPPAHLSAAQVYARWRAAADTLVPTTSPPLRLDQIERRRAGRGALARGLVQQFAAEETSVCELMAYVVAAEEPSQGDRVREILSRLAGDRRGASKITEQINATERAMVELWLVRFQEDPA